MSSKDVLVDYRISANGNPLWIKRSDLSEIVEIYTSGVFCSKLINTTSTVDTTNGADGSISTSGGLGVAKKIITQDTTDATAADTGSLQTKGGLYVAKAILLGTVPPEYADDAAAASGGLAVGGIYRTGSALKVRVS